MIREIIFASKNRGKINEVRNIFSDTTLEITSLVELNDNLVIDENESTFEGNARKKAKEVFYRFKIPVISDDSGIELEQMNGIPGVFSARYAGENANDEENNQKLIKELSNYPEPHPARYVCYAVFFDGKNFIIESGEIKGEIITQERGSSGFGYDPLFIPFGYNKTMAELSPSEKNSISHRAQAFNKLKKKIIMIMELI